MAQVIEGKRMPKHRVDMPLELLDIDALDTGQVHALVIQDPDDKRNIRGFFHFIFVRSKSMKDYEENFHNMNSYTHLLHDR